MVPTDIRALLRPLENFEALRRKAVRFGGNLCDLSYANPYAGAQEAAVAALGEALADTRALGLQYSPFGGQTIARRVVADALRTSHGLPFRYSDIVLTPGAMSALQIILRAVTHPGDEVIVPVPCWLDYPLYAVHVGAVPVMVRPDPATADLDIGGIVGCIGPRTRAILLCNPSNPTGRSFDRQTLAALAAAVAERADTLGIDVTIIADETHRDFTEPGSYQTIAAHYDRSVIAYSFGKYHFMQGQRLGYAAVSPRHPDRDTLSGELEQWTRITGIATPTALMQKAIPRLLKLTHDQSALVDWRRRYAARLTTAGYGVVEPNATLFMYVRTPSGYADEAFAATLAARGVLVLPATVFHHNGYFRLALTGSEEMLERALSVFEAEVRWAA